MVSDESKDTKTHHLYMELSFLNLTLKILFRCHINNFFVGKKYLILNKIINFDRKLRIQ